MIIVNIKEHKKTMSVTFDDGQVLKLPLVAKVDFLLYEGKEITQELFAELVKFSRQQKDYQYALMITSRFAYTTHEIKTKLAARGASSEDSGEIIAKLVELNYLNDERYAEERVNYLINVKKESRKSVIQKLKQKGLNEKLIFTYLSDDSEEQVINELALKVMRRYTKHSISYAKDKLITYLLRRGFKYGDIKNVVGTLDLKAYVDEEINIKQDLAIVRQKKVRDIQDKRELKKILYNELMKLKYSSFLINNVLEELDDEN